MCPRSHNAICRRLSLCDAKMAALLLHCNSAGFLAERLRVTMLQLEAAFTSQM